jgi:hypothetical protein
MNKLTDGLSNLGQNILGAIKDAVVPENAPIDEASGDDHSNSDHSNSDHSNSDHSNSDHSNSDDH